MIGLIGLDYRGTSAEQRGRLSFSGERLHTALRTLVGDTAIDEAVIVSTCNRTEVYIAAPDMRAAFATVTRFLGEAFNRGASALITAIPSSASNHDLATTPAQRTSATSDSGALLQQLVDALYRHDGVDAAQHLFRVAAGLQSMVLGESQILGQVKEALATADTVHAVGDELRSLFTIAIKVGKRARAETEIGRADVSIASLAIRVAGESLGGLAGKSALLIGAGRTSQLCAQLARSEGITRLVLANRSLMAAADLADEVHGEPIALDDIGEAIADVQLIISATAAPHTVLKASAVACAMAGRRSPLVVVDLAVPPDVEETVGLLPSVSLYTLDTLRSMDGQPEVVAGGTHAAEVARAEAIVDEGIRELLRSRAMRLAVPGIAALRRHVDHSEQAELALAMTQLEHLSPAERAIIARFGQRLVDKMFHHLVSRIRSLAEYDEVPPEVTMQVLSHLFADPGMPGAATTPTSETRAHSNRDVRDE